MQQYNQRTSTRYDNRTLAGRFRGGKLAPVVAHVMRENETATIEQQVHVELDPIAGRVITPISLELISILVPVPACDALKNPTQDLAGNAELVRQKLLSGNPLFGLEAENEISRRLGINPRSINGVKKVNEIGRLAHNVAVNYLRREKYVRATQIDAGYGGLTPALLSTTALDRLNGVLDPDDRINGAVNLTGDLPIKGIGKAWTGSTVVGDDVNVQVLETNGANGTSMAQTYPESAKASRDGPTDDIYIKLRNGRPDVHADLSGATDVRIRDFWRAERIDGITRELNQVLHDNPQYGEELVSRLAHGLSVDIGKEPLVLYRKTVQFNDLLRHGMDAAGLDTAQTDNDAYINFVVPVPATEFGGVVITFLSVKPDETIGDQPHPFLSEEWGAINFIADELAIDPVPVTMRELSSSVPQASENTIALYTANNGLKRDYTSYGFARNLNINTVAAKTAMWQLYIPLSVTPDSVIYPPDISHYPFADQTAEVCQYTVRSRQTVQTPIVFGPDPVETIGHLDTADIFEDE